MGKTITMTIASNAAAWCVACWFGSKILGIVQILNVKMLTEKGLVHQLLIKDKQCLVFSIQFQNSLFGPHIFIIVNFK